MLRSKLGLLGLCVMAVGLLAFGASAAQATTGWLILNAKGEVKTGAELKALVSGSIEKEDASLLTHIVKLAVTVLCTKGTLVGVSLEAAGKLTTGGKVKFEGCTTLNTKTGLALPECAVKSPGAAFGTVETNKGKGQLLESGLTEIKPETGEEFAKLEFETGCVLPSPSPISGVLFIKDCKNELEVHLKEHLIEEAEGTKLFIGADTPEHLETKIDGSALVFLAGEHAGLSWGGMKKNGE